MLAFLLIGTAGCTAAIGVDTEPVDVAIPVTSAGVAGSGYTEIAVDFPDAAQGDLEVRDANATLSMVNPSSGTAMTVSVRLSTQGQAEPGSPVFYTQANLPPYFASAALILGPKTYAAQSTTAERIESPALTSALGRPRLWFIVSNTVSSAGLGDVFPLEMQARNIVVHVTLERSFSGLAGALELSGL